MIRWRRAAGVASAVIATSACARANPAFDPESADTQAVTTGDSGGITLTAPGGDGKPPSSADGTGDGTSGPPGTGGATEPATSEDDGLPTDGEDTGVSECTFAPTFAPFTVDIAVSGSVMDLPCGQVHELVGPVQGYAADTITLVDCGVCDTCPDEPSMVSIHASGLENLPSWLTPVCARIEIAIGPEAEGCLPQTLLVSDAFGAQGPPEIIVTNRRDPPLLPALDPPIPAVLEPACDVSCAGDLAPGEYGLDFSNGQTVEPGVVTQGIALGTLDAGVVAQYDIFLRYGAIDAACAEHFGWAAVHTPG